MSAPKGYTDYNATQGPLRLTVGVYVLGLWDIGYFRLRFRVARLKAFGFMAEV